MTDPAPPAAAGLAYHRGRDGLTRWTDGPGLAGLAARAAAVTAVSVAACLVWPVVDRYGLFALACATQWAVVGVGMRLALRAARVRRRPIAVVATVAAALAAVVLLYPGLYLWDGLAVYRRSGGGIGLRRAFDLYDQYLLDRTGVAGLAGFVGMTVTRLSGAVFVHTVGTPWAAWAIAGGQLRAAHCPACGQPMAAPHNAAVVPVDHTSALVSAVTAGDVAIALAIVTRTAGAPLGSRCAVVRGYRCAACGSRAVDVVSKSFGGRQSAQAVVLRPPAVTDAMDDALRSEPVVPAPDDDTGPPADAA